MSIVVERVEGTCGQSPRAHFLPPGSLGRAMELHFALASFSAPASLSLCLCLYRRLLLYSSLPLLPSSFLLPPSSSFPQTGVGTRVHSINCQSCVLHLVSKPNERVFPGPVFRGGDENAHLTGWNTSKHPPHIFETVHHTREHGRDILRPRFFQRHFYLYLLCWPVPQVLLRPAAITSPPV